MSSEKQQTGQVPAAAPTEFYPPPPPGPPPGNNGIAQHSNETPIQEYHPQAYNPAQPQFAAPPSDQLYDEEPEPHHHHHFGHGGPEHAAHNEAAPADAQAAGAKVGWGQRLSALGQKAAVPFNTLASKLGSETFLPTTMDKECEKAARILRSFCSKSTCPREAWQDSDANNGSPEDGIYTETNTAPPVETADGKGKAKPKSRTLLTIPSKVINRAVGLAIFTTARAGFHVTGATGSGVLIARMADGSWSPPSGIQVYSVGAGFVMGIDIYDCVVVINTKEALEAFTRTRMALGSDLAVVAGPWGAGGSIEFAAPASEGKDKNKASAVEGGAPGAAAPHQGHPVEPVPYGEKPGPVPAVNEPQVTTGPETTTTSKTSTAGTSKDRKPSPFRQAISKPVYSYVKSRGFYAGVQVDGTVVTERKDANAAFYGSAIPVDKILKGEVPRQGPAGLWPAASKQLFDVVKGAEGWRGQDQGSAAAAPPAGVVPGPADQHAFAPPPGAAYSHHADPGVAGATAGVRHMDLGSAGSKADEAAAHQEPPPQSAAPPYSEPTHTDELPPAYVDDGQVRPGVGDTKGH